MKFKIIAEQVVEFYYEVEAIDISSAIDKVLAGELDGKEDCQDFHVIKAEEIPAQTKD